MCQCVSEEEERRGSSYLALVFEGPAESLGESCKFWVQLGGKQSECTYTALSFSAIACGDLFLGRHVKCFFWLGFGRLEDLESCLRWWDGKRVLEKKTVQGGGFILDSGIWIREL